MSKPKPYTAKPTAGATPATCADCKHWRERGEGPVNGVPVLMGLCVARPPAWNYLAGAFGPVCRYPVTLATETACGVAEPK